LAGWGRLVVEARPDFLALREETQRILDMILAH
jgi:hypothetical protein